MRLKIKVITKDEELFFEVAPAIYEIFKWHWEHNRDFKIANRVMKSDEILSIELMEIEVVE
ncbi:hypothetical protein [Streptococcus equinus]|uniref:hypothetical protein n=1 Tax=Streptococcus equinus TaxID=1335 RepID=UPI00088442BF|nr:hypothetical protein [Streptococcus equinus]QBX24713.1 hypothetical protein Javan202_0034 [Streptococcus phage Javan202]SDQ67043.1 hypothetical protein SAMN04488495_1798 [Streptococcus equinus]SEN67818.1 hypothetical protein SAMN04488496_0886 [Streptococcus equinus]